MSQSDLEALVNELRQILADPGELDADERRRLDTLAAEIERRLAGEEHEGLFEQMHDSVTEFEVSHPQLSNVIGRIAHALSAGGL